MAFYSCHSPEIPIPPRFIQLILACISTASVQFNLNDKVVGSVMPSRGILQGDPLSPYLFLLCAEGFSSLLHLKERRQALSGFKVARRAPDISHLLFADDSFLFCQPSISSCNIIKDILDVYERATGQKVNFQKSSLYFSPNVELRDQTLISDFMRIPVRSSFEKYLGLPQHIGQTKKQLFHYLHDKVWGHLHNWKNKVFSKGGKETLLKSVIQAIPMYSMACFRLPVATCHSLESIMANFWWGVNDNNRPKTHWQSWNKLYRVTILVSLPFPHLISPPPPHLCLGGNTSGILTSPPRNKALKGQPNDQAHAILNLAQSFLTDYHSSMTTSAPSDRPSHSPTPSSWSPPPPGLLKLNVDASVSKVNGKVGFGGIIRNSEGLVVAALAHPYNGGGAVATLEAKALLTLLRWCIYEHFLIHEVETDCKAITYALYYRKEDISVFGDLIRQIKNSLSHFPARLSHVNREANSLADKLAYRASGLDEVAIWIGDDPCDLIEFLSS
uniref:Reverse transcriptase domain-containing protein n=1 Tax=Cannabis sativa TaxID=3483 RepID=A0A803PJL2_CANSA